MFKNKLTLNRKTITLTCLLFGYVWVIVTDLFAGGKFNSIRQIFDFDTTKGLVYVTIASIGLYVMLYFRDEKVAHTEKYAGTILETANVAIAVADQDGYITQVNNRCAQLFGYQKQELHGKHVTYLAAREDQEEVEREFRQAIHSSDNSTLEWSGVNHRGNTIPLLINFGCLESPLGDKMAVLSMTDITPQKNTQQKLEDSLHEKNVLLAEIHHRVKNNLAIISGFLQLQRFNTEDEQLSKALNESEMRIRSMAKIHEKLYESESFSRIPIRDYITDLTKTIRDIYANSEKSIELDLACDDINLNINQAIPFGLLLNEVISNAFEHAFRNRSEGLVSIDVQDHGGDIRAIIKDNGIGLPDNFEEIKKHSLGSSIIENLVSQLEGELEIESGKGTQVMIVFEIKDTKGSGSMMPSYSDKDKSA